MNTGEIKIKPSIERDFDSVMEIHKKAFGEDDEARLTADLLNDPSAEPVISLLALHKNRAVGHILFTRVYVNGQDSPLMHILAPLAVLPEYQKMGIGAVLIESGIEALRNLGSELVFVLGHIDYYPRTGFRNNAKRLGFEAPYIIPEEVADAWMVQELVVGALQRHNGKITCADMLMKPEYWRE